MINTKDQEELLRLLADYLEQDVECLAIGGTAMMFHGYNNATKDVDLVFRDPGSRQVFIKALEKLGYSQKSILDVFDKKRQEHSNKPLMYSRGDERFDLFVADVFGFEVDFSAYDQRIDFIGKQELILYSSTKEFLILLKSVTNRQKDYEDIETIARLEKDIDWDKLVDLAILQRKNVPWILYDLEEKMRLLKKVIFIKKAVFDKIYGAEEGFSKKA